MSLVIDYSIKCQISAQVNKLVTLKKYLWENDRKSFKKVKILLDRVMIFKERMSYWIMKDPEVTVERAEENVNDIAEMIREIIATIGYEDRLNPIFDELDGIKMMLAMADHTESMFSYL